MKFNHKKVYQEVCKKFDLYYGKENSYPSNYTCFYKNIPELQIHKYSFMRIENIPTSKKYMKIAYVMFDSDEPINKDIYSEILEQYRAQRKNIGVSMQIDNNSIFDSVMV